VSGMLHSIPIYAVMVENLGERGAYYTALRLLQQEVNSASIVDTTSIDGNYSSFAYVSTVIVVTCLAVGGYVYSRNRGK